MNVLSRKHFILNNPKSVEHIADHLAAAGSIAVLDVGVARALVGNGLDPLSEVNVWNSKQRLNGKIWGTLGDEDEVLALLDKRALPEKYFNIFTRQNLKHFRGVFIRYPCLKSKVPELLRNSDGTHQTLICKDPLNRYVQYKIRNRLGGYPNSLLIATSFNFSGRTPGMTKLVETMKLVDEMDIPVVGHRFFKRNMSNNGTYAIFSITKDGIKLERQGSGEKEVIKNLSELGYRVDFGYSKK